MDHRQGPLRVPLRHRAGPAHLPAGARPEDGGDGELRPASWPEAFAVAARGLQRRGRRGRPHRRPGHRRGRLRLQQVRPGRARHQRHRLPGPAALGRGGRLPRRRGRAAHRRSTYADLETAATVVLAGLEPEDEAGTIFLRLRKAALHRPHPRRRDRAVRHPRPAQDGRPRWCRPRPATRPRRSTQLATHGEFGLDGDRRDPGRRAAGHLARRAHRRRDAGPHHRRPAGLGAAPRRRPRRGRGRLPAHPAARRPSGRRRRRPRRRRHRLGRRPPARHRRPRRRRRSSPRCSPASSAAWSSAASTPTTPPTRPPPGPRSRPRPSWSPSSCARPT